MADKYAIIKTGGKQIKVSIGEPIWGEKLEANVEETFTFEEVLAYSDGSKLSYGKPLLEGVTVTATVQKQGRGKKVTIFRTKAKSNWSRKQGHRQPYTRLIVDAINVK